MPGWAWAGVTEDRPAVAQDAAPPPAASAPFRKSRRPSCSPCSVSLAMSVSFPAEYRVGAIDADLRWATSLSRVSHEPRLINSALASRLRRSARTAALSPEGEGCEGFSRSGKSTSERSRSARPVPSAKAGHHVAGEQLDAPARL